MSSPPTTTKTLVNEFVTRLEELAAAGQASGPARADLARLRRCAGRPFGECTAAFPILYRLLPWPWHDDDRRAEDCLLVASLFPLAPTPAANPGGSPDSLGASFARAAQKQPTAREGIERRLRVLLDCPRESLDFRIRQAVRFLASHEAGIDWSQLLTDLIDWTREDRRVQKQWARDFYGAAPETTDTPAAQPEHTEGDTDAR